MLQLVVRTEYRGVCDLLGTNKTDNKSVIRDTPPSLLASRRFFVQVSNRTDCFFQGCCLDHHVRAFFLREMHFIDFHRGQWDLYANYCGVSRRRANNCARFVLVPHVEELVVQECRNWPKWEYLGPCEPSIMRMELEEKIIAFLKRANNSSGVKTGPTYHWHLEVFMDTLKDYGDWPWRELAKSRSSNQGRAVSTNENGSSAHDESDTSNEEVSETDGKLPTRTHNAPTTMNGDTKSSGRGKSNREVRRGKMEQHALANLTNTEDENKLANNNSNKTNDWRSILWEEGEK